MSRTVSGRFAAAASSAASPLRPGADSLPSSVPSLASALIGLGRKFGDDSVTTRIGDGFTFWVSPER